MYRQTRRNGIVTLQMISSRVTALVAAAAVATSGLVTARLQGQRPLEVSLFPASINPGDVVRIDVSGASEKGVTATLLGQHVAFSFAQDRSSWSGLAGVDL